MTIVITTNHHARETIDAWALTPDEREQFDYLDWPAIEAGTDSATFVRYRGELIDLGDIPAIGRRESWPVEFRAWHGVRSESFFSGLLFRYAGSECDYVVIASYYVKG